MKSKVGWGKALKTTAPVAKVIELSLSDSVDEWGNMFDWFTDIQRYTFRFSFSYPSTMQDLASLHCFESKDHFRGLCLYWLADPRVLSWDFPKLHYAWRWRWWQRPWDHAGADLCFQSSARILPDGPSKVVVFFLFCASSMNLCHHTSVTRATWVPWGLLILFHQSLQHLLLLQSRRLQRGKPKQNKRRGMKYGKVDCNSLVFV